MEVDTLNNGLPYTIAFFLSFLLHFCSIFAYPTSKIMQLSCVFLVVLILALEFLDKMAKYCECAIGIT